MTEEPTRTDLIELLQRRAMTEDAARPDAVERRHAAGGRTARENVADLVDPGSFVEYGRFAVAPQRGRRTMEDLIARTPADGLVAGTAQINGEHVGPERAACACPKRDFARRTGGAWRASRWRRRSTRRRLSPICAQGAIARWKLPKKRYWIACCTTHRCSRESAK